MTWERIQTVLSSRASATVKDAVASRAAVALVLRDSADGMEILFIRRAVHPQDPWSGQMGFPGGRFEPGDADLKSTAIRETAEETGIDLTSAEYLGPLDEVRATARMRPLDLAIMPFVFRLQGPVEPTLSEEVASVHWLPLEVLLGREVRSSMEYTHQGSVLQFPCLRFTPLGSLTAIGGAPAEYAAEELIIWGLTYRMFTSFQELLAPPDPAEVAQAPGDGRP